MFIVANLALVTPHSNAGIGRVYSIVNKNRAESSDRNKLDVERSLYAILAVKMDQPKSFSKYYNFKNPVKNCLRRQRKQLPNTMTHIRLLHLKNNN